MQLDLLLLLLFLLGLCCLCCCFCCCCCRSFVYMPMQHGKSFAQASNGNILLAVNRPSTVVPPSINHARVPIIGCLCQSTYPSPSPSSLHYSLFLPSIVIPLPFIFLHFYFFPLALSFYPFSSTYVCTFSDKKRGVAMLCQLVQAK